jgi:methylenetetrahydrofolate reductase (NADPH)
VKWIRQETTVNPMAHLTCQGHVRSEIEEILAFYADSGVENILALGGDAPADGASAPSDYTYASELLDDVLATGRFSVGVAAHPEVHPRSPDRATDRRHLADKLLRADFAITQFFFEVDVYTELVNELRDLGVDKPVIPGIMPVTNKSQILRMAQMSGAAFPTWLADRLDAVDDPEDVRRIGVEAATELCRDLLDADAPGLHFYTLNRSTATREIYANLGLPVTR